MADLSSGSLEILSFIVGGLALTFLTFRFAKFAEKLAVKFRDAIVRGMF